ncbi:MAG: AAA family ATPase [Anaerolineae bacterium]|nr:AAA family ATPase [Anaerolineae bacterium]
MASLPADVNLEALNTLDDSWLARLLHYQPALLSSVHDLLDAATAYMPWLVADRLLKAPETGPISMSLEGTLMFADIDGFTPLAERFSQVASREGAEELTRLVDRFLEILIRIAIKYGGDVQKFGGDAGMLLFQGEQHALRAAAASLEVQQVMKEQMGEVKTSLGSFPLQIAIGLGSGRLIGFSLGDKHGREFLTIGPPLDAMGEAQSAAPPGETLLDPLAMKACADQIACITLDGPLYQVVGLKVQPAPHALPILLDPPKTGDLERLKWMLKRLDALTPYLAPGLLERLVDAPSIERIQLLSEHRQVTVMMLTLAGLRDLMPFWGKEARLQQAIDEPNAAFKQVRDTVLRYDGIVNKIGVSPKGPYLMVLFGAPNAHEDDPLRAVLAALELQEIFNHTLCFGINSGYVFAGDVGTARRREYTVMGDEVNLAARLMTYCKPGEIWLGPKTSYHSAVTRRIAGDFGPPTKFKGKREPISPFIATGLRPVFSGMTATETSIVGREIELQRLSRLLDLVKAGRMQMVLLHGKVGVGKTRLAHEVTHCAKDLGFSAYMGVAPSYGAHLPFAGWDTVLLALLGLESVPDAARPGALIAAMARYGLDTWAALIGPLVGVNVPPSSEVLALPPHMRDMQRQGTLRELWEKASQEKPCLLFMDNAQWMSPASLDLLGALLTLPDTSPLAVVLTCRDDTSLIERWEGDAHVVDLPLGALPDDAMAALVQHLFQEVPLPGAVIEWLVARSSGMPLFATEAARALIDTGLLRRSNGTWELAGSLEDFPLPDMVYGLIQSRIDQLSPPNRHLLRAAAAVGDDMTLPMLVAAYGEENEVAVRRRVPQLAPLGLSQRDYTREELVFRQPLVREVAYRGLPFSIQRMVHQRLTAYLDYHRERAATNWLTLLAYHAYEGQLWETAVEANLALGQQAVRSFLAEQARQALERVLSAADNGGLEAPEARFEAHHLLGETLTSFGLYEEALAHIDAARRMLPASPEAAEDIARLADLDSHEAAALEAQGEYERALSVVARGLALPDVMDTLEAARLYLMGSGLYRRQKDYDTAREWANRSLTLTGLFSQREEAHHIRSRAMYMIALLSSLQRLKGQRG